MTGMALGSSILYRATVTQCMICLASLSRLSTTVFARMQAAKEKLGMLGDWGQVENGDFSRIPFTALWCHRCVPQGTCMHAWRGADACVLPQKSEHCQRKNPHQGHADPSALLQPGLCYTEGVVSAGACATQRVWCQLVLVQDMECRPLGMTGQGLHEWRICTPLFTRPGVLRPL